jgi:dipeptidase D
MRSLLDDLEPKGLWRYFLALSAIPRRSGDEARAAAFVAEEGRTLRCSVEEDEAGNVLRRREPAPGHEGRPPLALQAHLDMVCAKEEGSSHDFAREGLEVWRDGEHLRARGTTLGADNGIGVAAALAVLAEQGFGHGPLEALFTVDEERGLRGAKRLPRGFLRAGKLLNLDSEEEGVLTVGCAGAMDTVASRAVTFAPPVAGTCALHIAVTGLRGGHSGFDIGRGRGNALRVLAEVLDSLGEGHSLSLSSLAGGSARNAIPREASALVQVESAEVGPIRKEVARLGSELRATLGAADPGLEILVREDESGPVMSAPDARATIGLLLAAPHGVEAFSQGLPGLVETSTNLARVTTGPYSVEVAFLTRSSNEASRAALARRIAAVCRLAGFEAHDGHAYPGWKPDPNSALAKVVSGLHEELFGTPMRIGAVHAGLECGLIGEGHPGLKMVSFGPDMWDVHTPNEHLSIASAARFYRLLLAAVERA